MIGVHKKGIYKKIIILIYTSKNYKFEIKKWYRTTSIYPTLIILKNLFKKNE